MSFIYNVLYLWSNRFNDFYFGNKMKVMLIIMNINMLYILLFRFIGKIIYFLNVKVYILGEI